MLWWKVVSLCRLHSNIFDCVKETQHRIDDDDNLFFVVDVWRNMWNMSTKLQLADDTISAIYLGDVVYQDSD